MFIKVRIVPENKSAATDVIKKDKKEIKYRALFNILKSIRFVFIRKQTSTVT